jgi:ATP-dependent RNA helicase RhlE
MTFENLNLIGSLSGALKEKGYLQPTPIQQQAIPKILEGNDIFGCAQTGTGKTASFALPILQLLHERPPVNGRPVRALIMAPTRELAMQISENISTYGKKLQLKHTVVTGGVSQNNQVRNLQKGVDILVATPGRLLDLINQRIVKLKNVEILVLDEADRMLDMGFINDIRKIITHIPAKRQTLMFSATVPNEIRKLSESLQHHPVQVNVAPSSTVAATVQQSVFHVKKENKKYLLQHLLKDRAIEHALVFTRTKRGADRVAKDLNKTGVKAEAIHGNKSQNARERALKGFKSREIRILVATDIASRGIDVDKLTHVINFEIPEQAETYVHRIGRTGRAGESGVALSFCTQDEMTYLKDIQRLIRKNIQVVSSHPYSAIK